MLVTGTVLDASSCLFSSRRPQTCSYSSPSRPNRSVTTVRDHKSHDSSGVHYLVLEGRKQRKEEALSLQTSQGISLWRVMCAPGQSRSLSPMEVLVLTTGQPQSPPTCTPPPSQHNARQDADMREGRGAVWWSNAFTGRGEARDANEVSQDLEVEIRGRDCGGSPSLFVANLTFIPR